MKAPTYHEQQKKDNVEKLRGLLLELPEFMGEYFRGANRISSNMTKVAYAYDIKIFFAFLRENHKTLKGKNIRAFELSDLELVAPEDIDIFLEYVTYYENPKAGIDGKQYLNDDKAKARKLCAIRSVYKYFYLRRKITVNPSDFVAAPKLKEKNITVLEPNEVAQLLDFVESGEKLTDKQKEYHEYTKTRDLALVSLLLGTGMRVSECVGIDIDDIDFDVDGVKIVRKGGNEAIVYFGDEVREPLLEYLEIRSEMKPKDTNAFFLSLQNKRINVRTVQILVKKYAQSVTMLKNISPHKLRSTYGTTLYRESGDIYLVADALGHSDVNTTKKHYARIDDDRRRSAAGYIKLR